MGNDALDATGLSITQPQHKLTFVADPGPTATFVICGSGNTRLVTIYPDGRVEYGPDYTPDEAARIFWEAMAAYAPTTPLAAENGRLKSKYLSLYRTWRNTLKILEPFRQLLENIRDGLEDEGDRVYFGSTNDADHFKEVANTLEGLAWDEVLAPAHKEAADLYSELAAAKAINADLVGLLQDAQSGFISGSAPDMQWSEKRDAALAKSSTESGT